MALNPHSERPELGAPEDYQADHPDDHPEDWGWHGEWGRWARVSGYVVAIILLVMLTTTHYNHSGAFWLVGFTAALLIVLIWDFQRRRTSWRK